MTPDHPFARAPETLPRRLHLAACALGWLFLMGSAAQTQDGAEHARSLAKLETLYQQSCARGSADDSDLLEKGSS